MIEKLKETIKSLLPLIITAIASVLITLYLVSPSRVPTGDPSSIPLEDLSIKSTTGVSAAYKASPESSDLILNQTYTAEVNGTKVTVPVTGTPSGSSNGTQGTITQEIDLTNMMSYVQEVERKKAQKDFKRNWEVSVGLGVHNDDFYIPVELQRNYKADKAISIEIHLDPSGLSKVTGGEVKHTWKL